MSLCVGPVLEKGHSDWQRAFIFLELGCCREPRMRYQFQTPRHNWNLPAIFFVSTNADLLFMLRPVLVQDIGKFQIKMGEAV